jgi:hypothetical protein
MARDLGFGISALACDARQRGRCRMPLRRSAHSEEGNDVLDRLVPPELVTVWVLRRWPRSGALADRGVN